MNLIIDILHPAHLNLFKKTIIDFTQKGHQVHVLCINRGKLPKIVSHELAGINVRFIGKHRGTRFSIIWEANVVRFFKILWFVWTHKIDVGISFGSFLLGLAVKLKGGRNIHLSDDPERKLNEKLELLTCDERYLPPLVNPKGKTQTFNALKEWAYLSPKYFISNIDTLEEYQLSSKKYIFIREISTGSLNYIDQTSNVIAQFAHELKGDFRVILSLEDKETAHLYPKEWILLQEPVKNIHSLIFFSRLVISSGDSMAREGAMLGVPSIYCGSRVMKANELLINKGMLFHVESDVPGVVSSIISGKMQLQDQKVFRNSLLKEWVDVNQFISNIILKNPPSKTPDLKKPI